MFNYYFLVADTDLCQFVLKIKVPKLPEFQKFFGRRYQSLPVCFKVPKLPEFQKFFGRRY